MLRSKNNNLIWNGSGPRLETGHPVIGYVASCLHLPSEFFGQVYIDKFLLKFQYIGQNQTATEKTEVQLVRFVLWSSVEETDARLGAGWGNQPAKTVWWRGVSARAGSFAGVRPGVSGMCLMWGKMKKLRLVPIVLVVLCASIRGWGRNRLCPGARVDAVAGCGHGCRGRVRPPGLGEHRGAEAGHRQRRGRRLFSMCATNKAAAAHIPGSINIPRGLLEFSIWSLIPDRNEKMLVYCKTGARAAYQDTQRAGLRPCQGCGHRQSLGAGGLPGADLDLRQGDRAAAGTMKPSLNPRIRGPAGCGLIGRAGC